MRATSRIVSNISHYRLPPVVHVDRDRMILGVGGGNDPRGLEEVYDGYDGRLTGGGKNGVPGVRF